MTKKGLLLVISGPSGVGKGTICKVLNRRSDLWFSVSATTRSPRNGEEDGKNYYFIDKEDFLKRIDNGDFLEYAEVYGNYYGTPKSNALEMLDKGFDVILEIDTQGAAQVMENYSEGIYIFILPPSMKELQNRITNRGSETSESLATRLNAAHDEISCMTRYNYAVVNDEVEEAAKKIESIIIAEKCKVSRFKEIIFDCQEGLVHE